MVLVIGQIGIPRGVEGARLHTVEADPRQWTGYGTVVTAGAALPLLIPSRMGIDSEDGRRPIIIARAVIGQQFDHPLSIHGNRPTSGQGHLLSRCRPTQSAARVVPDDDGGISLSRSLAQHIAPAAHWLGPAATAEEEHRAMAVDAEGRPDGRAHADWPYRERADGRFLRWTAKWHRTRHCC